MNNESEYYIYRFIGLAVATIVFSALVVLSTEYTGFKAALKLHSDMADHIIFAPMKWVASTFHLWIPKNPSNIDSIETILSVSFQIFWYDTNISNSK